MSRPLALFALAALVLAPSAGCIHSTLQPKPADVLDRGETGLMVNFNVAGYARGQVDDMAPRYSILNHPMDPITILFGFLYNNLTLELRHAFIDDLEVGAVLGFQKLGGAVRYGVLQQDRGDALSLAAEVAGGWRPWSKGPWGRAGVDVSHTAGQTHPFLNAYVTYGRELHAIARRDYTCRGFGQPGCSEYGPPLHFLIRRDELRLHGSIGALFPDVDPSAEVGTRLGTAFEGYLTLRGSDTVFEQGGVYQHGSRFTERGGLFGTFLVQVREE